MSLHVNKLDFAFSKNKTIQLINVFSLKLWIFVGFHSSSIAALFVSLMSLAVIRREASSRDLKPYTDNVQMLIPKT